MKKKIYTPPILEELSVDDIQLLAGAGSVTAEPKPWESGGGDPDPGRPPKGSAPEYQFNEVE